MGDTVLLAAGGTGGHVFPGLATADALKRLRPDLDVVFVGTAERLEARLVPQAGYELHTVPAMAFRKDASLLKLPFVLGGAVRSVRTLIHQRNVIAAVGFGGYTSVPLALAARVTGLPLVVHEQNAVPGRANAMAARAARAVAVTFPEALGAFGDTRTVLTGNPVRPALLPAEAKADPAAHRVAQRASAREHFGLRQDRTTVLVFGGSQGALRINDAIVGAAGMWAHPDRLQILHATGAKTAAQIQAAWDAAPADGTHVEVREFIERMDLAYAAADLVICRAGASSIAELTALGVPSLLVPYPHATADHQTANARGLVAAGGATMVADGDLTAQSLVAMVDPLLQDSVRLDTMATAAAAAGHPDAAHTLAELTLEVARP